MAQEIKTESTVPELTSKAKVLCIGNDEEYSGSDKPEAISKRKRFRIRANRHLSTLLIGIRTPSDIYKEYDSLEYFSVSSIKINKHITRYQFHCGRNKAKVPYGIYWSTTFNAQIILNEVKKRLSGENWISNYVIESPLKTKPADLDCYPDSYIQCIVSESLKAESEIIFKFVHQLHLEHMKKN